MFVSVLVVAVAVVVVAAVVVIMQRLLVKCWTQTELVLVSERTHILHKLYKYIHTSNPIRVARQQESCKLLKHWLDPCL